MRINSIGGEHIEYLFIHKRVALQICRPGLVLAVLMVNLLFPLNSENLYQPKLPPKVVRKRILSVSLVVFSILSKNDTQKRNCVKLTGMVRLTLLFHINIEGEYRFMWQI